MVRANTVNRPFASIGDFEKRAFKILSEFVDAIGPAWCDGGAMKNQYESSVTHANNINLGLAVEETHELGSGDSSVSLVRYNDGSTWVFDNGSATQLGTVHGWPSANMCGESAWFPTREAALDFATGCGDILGDPLEVSADFVELSGIMA